MQNQQNQQDFQQAIQSSIAFLEANGYSVSAIQEAPNADADGWIKNTGERPVDANILVDVKFDDGYIYDRRRADYWFWDLEKITHWRLAR